MIHRAKFFVVLLWFSTSEAPPRITSIGPWVSSVGTSLIETIKQTVIYISSVEGGVSIGVSSIVSSRPSPSSSVASAGIGTTRRVAASAGSVGTITRHRVSSI